MHFFIKKWKHILYNGFVACFFSLRVISLYILRNRFLQHCFGISLHAHNQDYLTKLYLLAS